MALVLRSRDSTEVVVMDVGLCMECKGGSWRPCPRSATISDLSDFLLVEGSEATKLLSEAHAAASSSLAPKAKIFFGPSQLTKLTRAYGQRFNTIVPSSVFRSVSAGKISIKELEARIAQAIQEGRPDAQWESELEQVRATDPANMSVSDMVDRSALDRLQAEGVPGGASGNLTGQPKKPVKPIKIRSATAEDYAKRSNWNISLGPFKEALPKAGAPSSSVPAAPKGQQRVQTNRKKRGQTDPSE